MSYVYQILAKGTPFRKSSVENSFLGAAEVIVIWSSGFEKIFDLQLWVGYSC